MPFVNTTGEHFQIISPFSGGNFKIAAPGRTDCRPGLLFILY
jgi:hypothetical protein